MPTVVHVSSVHKPFDTRIFAKECRTLAGAGYRVILVVPHDREETVDGVSIRPVPRPVSRWQRMRRTARQAIELALRQQADLFHLHDFELLPWAWKLRRTG